MLRKRLKAALTLLLVLTMVLTSNTSLVTAMAAEAEAEYSVSFEKTENGSVKTADNKKTYQKGAKVTLKAEANEGYKLSDITVTAGKDKIKTTEEKGNVTFTMPASDVKVKSEFAKAEEAEVVAETAKENGQEANGESSKETADDEDADSSNAEEKDPDVTPAAETETSVETETETVKETAMETEAETEVESETAEETVKETEAETETEAKKEVLYKVNLDNANGFVMTANGKKDLSVKAGESVKIEFSKYSKDVPFGGIEVTFDKGKEINVVKVKEDADGAFEFTMPESDVNVKVLSAEVAEAELLDYDSKDTYKVTERINSPTGLWTYGYLGKKSSDASLAYCMEHNDDPPEKGDSYKYIGMITSSITSSEAKALGFESHGGRSALENALYALKICYYGFGGSKQKTGSALATTHALSVAYCGDPVDDRCEGFLAKIADLKPAPATFAVYMFAPTKGAYYQTLCTFSDIEEEDHEGKLKVVKSGKHTADLGLDDNDCYTLAGAEYGVFASDTTDSKGMIKGEPLAVLTTNGSGKTSAVSLEVGTYYVQEITAPRGYQLNKEIKTVKITEDNTKTLEVTDEERLDPIQINIYKSDAESGTGKPLAAASLENGQFKIEYYDTTKYGTVSELDAANIRPTRTWVIKTGRAGLARLNKMDLVSGDDLYMVDGRAVVPEGTIVITEVKAPAGYLLSGKVITEDRKTVNGLQILTRVKADDSAEGGASAYAGHTYTFSDYVARADIKFTKTDESGVPLAGVSFEIASKTTGEKYVVKTDENGVFDSSAVKHTDENGVWFYGVPTGDERVDKMAINDEMGAFPVDSYTITELRTDANAGYALMTPNPVEFEIKSGDNSNTVDLGTFIDKNVSISTTAKDKETGAKLISGRENVILEDTVYCENLEKDAAYKLVATVMDKTTGKAFVTPEGKILTAEKEFTASDVNCDETVEFPAFDATELKGVSLVVFEKLYILTGDDPQKEESWTESASHEDIDDEGQTVRFGGGHTTATGMKTGTHLVYAEKDIEIVDVVTYTNLIADGREYTVEGVLMDKETGKALTDDNGKEVTAKTTFVPEESDGSVEVIFKFDGVKLAGTKTVAFETVTQDDVEVFVHKDINDESQEVDIPKMKTTALSKDGTKNVLAGKDAVIVDTVTYEKLVPGETYKVTGVLMNKKTKKPVKVNGKEITAEAEFEAKTSEGTVDVEFKFDATGIKDSIVVFEKMFDVNGNLIADHEDINDEDQTVTVPHVGTKATGNGGKTVDISKSSKVTITDTISYEGLTPGQKYKAYGVIMDKKTGSELKIGGKTVTAVKEFTPEKSSGTVSVDFTFDAKDLSGKSVVVFETVYLVTADKKDVEIANHKDINDKDQTVSFVKKDTPKTGDEMSKGMLAGMAALTIISLAVILFLLKKKIFR